MEKTHLKMRKLTRILLVVSMFLLLFSIIYSIFGKFSFAFVTFSVVSYFFGLLVGKHGVKKFMKDVFYLVDDFKELILMQQDVMEDQKDLIENQDIIIKKQDKQIKAYQNKIDNIEDLQNKEKELQGSINKI